MIVHTELPIEVDDQGTVDSPAILASTQVAPTRLRSLKQAGVLLDRDGTIIVDHGYVGSVDRVELIEGAAAAIAAFNRAGVPVAVVTNQSGVARGYYTTADVDAVHRHISERLAEHGAHVDLFLFCPDHPEGIVAPFARRSADRKPAPGMALAAAESLGLDLAASWVVGDRAEDMGLAAAVGASGIFLGPDGCEHDGLCAFPDLATAAGFILDHIDRARTRVEVSIVGTPTRAPRPKFPAEPFERPASYWNAYLTESQQAARSIPVVQIDRATTVLLEAYRRGAGVFSCGNGGSAAIANHFQCDHLKGVRTSTDLLPRAVSLSANIELVMAIANDLSYADIFSYQLQSQARTGDVLIAISSSGCSENIVRALSWARNNGLRTIALTGFEGGEARKLADVSIHVPSSNYGVVEDIHQAIMHTLAQYIRQSRMSADAIARARF